MIVGQERSEPSDGGQSAEVRATASWPRGLSYWLFKKLCGQGEIRKNLAYLEASESLDRRALKELQYNKLRRCLENAIENVPYYASVARERGFDIKHFQNPEDIRKLPLLDRPTLLKNYPQLCSTLKRPGIYDNFSSGSTGHNAQFKQDASFDMWCRAHQLRTYQWCGGWSLGEPFALIWGSPVYWKMFSMEKTFSNYLSNRKEFNCYNLSDKSVSRMLAGLARFQPVLISGYTTAIYLLAAKALETGVRFTRLRAVQPTAEAMPPHMRKVIEQGFGVPAYNKYGSRETNIIAHEAPDRLGMYLQMENSFVEFLNEDDRWCKPGEQGRLVVTTLNNHTMPLIRYETGDLATPLPIPEDAAYPFDLMSEVHGRSHDTILTPEEGRIHPQLFSNIFMGVDEIRWFQVVQEKDDTLEISIYVPYGIRDVTVADLVERIRKMTGYAFDIRFRHLSEMPYSKTGKYRLCVCRIDNNSEVQA